MQQQRLEEHEQLRSATLAELRKVLGELLPGQRVIVFGSLVKAGRFSDTSDIDLALASDPPNINIYELSSLIGERMGRETDVLLLSECRFREKILREGQAWILPG